jgi:hypothetical protein
MERLERCITTNEEWVEQRTSWRQKFLLITSGCPDVHRLVGHEVKFSDKSISE